MKENFLRELLSIVGSPEMQPDTGMTEEEMTDGSKAIFDAFLETMINVEEEGDLEGAFNVGMAALVVPLIWRINRGDLNIDALNKEADNWIRDMDESMGKIL